MKIDPELDLKLEREIAVPVEDVFRAWTTPAELKHWFTPRPWQTVECEIDLKPGGIFRTVMQSPQGERFDNAGCYLEIVENRKLVWTDCLEPGFRPAQKSSIDDMVMTAMILLEPTSTGCKYTAIAMHGTPGQRKQHEDMGFEHGWGTVVEQLVEYIKNQ